MSLNPRTHLGPYEILEPIGRGGMGEVYRARDRKLGRDVAIKVLPETFARDPARMARFDREARALASLNHPHIASIYGLEEPETTRALVLELVEGSTLRELLSRGPLPLEEALSLGRQMAEGLEAAHDKGIIHRDLKPGNIMVTHEGALKILDFGLAKVFEPDATDSDLSQSPTLTREGTETGVILGTPAYLSPEQARGKEVDRRSDIWAFGCCLYELITGKAAFLGETVSDTIAKILGEEPDWKFLPAGTPVAVRKLLRRCLRKDSRQRLQAIGDARVELEELLAGEHEDEPRTSAPSAWAGVLPWALVAVLSILVGVLLWRLRTRETEQPFSARLDIVLPAEVPMAPWASPRMSPDGTRLVYAAEVVDQWQLQLRDMSTGETRAIPGTEGGGSPFFSPDGEWLGFFSDGKLEKVSLAGGEPVVLADAPTGMGGAWAPDDTIHFNTMEAEGISRVPAAGGQAHIVTEEQHWWPDILPGEALLFVGHMGGGDPGIYVLTNGQTRKLLDAQAFEARYVPTGHIVFAERGKLRAVAFDVAALEIRSQPVTLVEDLRTSGPFGGAPFTLSRDGSLIYASGQDREIASLVWVDRQGNVEPLGLEPGLYGQSFSLSPDGTQIAVPVREGRGSDIWLYDIARDALTRFTYDLRVDRRATNHTPRWTPDGRHIVYSGSDFSSADGDGPRQRLFWKPSDGSREAVPLTSDDAPRRLQPDSFSPDGSVLTFFAVSVGAGFDIGFLRLDGIDPYAGRLPERTVSFETRFSEAWARFSPDGQWIAYVSNESGQYEVYVRRFPDGPRRQISSGGGLEAMWHPSKPLLFYRSGSQFFAVDVRLTPEFRAGRPRWLFEAPVVDQAGYDVELSPDGERFLTLYGPDTYEPNRTLTVITNFFDELRRRVPPSVSSTSPVRQ